MEMGEFRYPVYTLDSKADLNYGEAQAPARAVNDRCRNLRRPGSILPIIATTRFVANETTDSFSQSSLRSVFRIRKFITSAADFCYQT